MREITLGRSMERTSDDFKHEERKKRQRKLHKGASNDEEKAQKGKGKH